MNNYRAQIDRAIYEATGDVVMNGSTDHAAVIIERIFANATNSVRILSRRLDPRVFGTNEVLEQARVFTADPDRKISILVEELTVEKLAQNPLVQTLRPYILSGDAKVGLVSEARRKTLPFNFTLLDKLGYRYESDKNKAVAHASFGGSAADTTASMCGLFGTIWAESTDVSEQLLQS